MNRTTSAPHVEERKPIATSSWFGGVVALLLLLAGGIGSVYSTEIKSNPPFTWLDSGRWGPFVFWGTVVLCGLLLIYRQGQVDAVREQVQERMMGLATDLKETVQTMPPEGILKLYAELYAEADYALAVVLSSPPANRDPGLVPAAIRRLLRLVAALAQAFDRNPAGTSYSANLMLFRASGSIPDHEKASVESRLQFCAEEMGKIDALHGVLELRNDLSATLDGEGAEPAEWLPVNFALPIPNRVYANHKRPGESRLRFRIIPGAPVAFALGTFSQVPDTSRLDDWCAENTILTTDDIHHINHYFRELEGANIGSFVSIAILPVTDPQKEKPGEIHAPSVVEEIEDVELVRADIGVHLPFQIYTDWDGGEIDDNELEAQFQTGRTVDPVAILNIDSSRPNLLRGSDRLLDQFYDALTPFRILLARLVREL